MVTLEYLGQSGGAETSAYSVVRDGRVVGSVEISRHPTSIASLPEDMASNLYYEIHENERGKGYGSEAFAAALDEATTLGLERLLVCVREDDAPSKHLADKYGSFPIREHSTRAGEIYQLYQVELPDA